VMDKPFGIVYAAKNKITGKIYIGQTIVSLNERKGDHRRKAAIWESKSHFHSAIRKYGFDVFTWEIIDKAESRDELNHKEKHWIAFYNSANPSTGYNLTHGGDSFELTEEARKKIGDACRGIKRSESFKAHLREIEKGAGNPFYGRKHTEETKKKNGAAHRGKKLRPEHVAKCLKCGSDNGMAKINESIALDIKIRFRNGQRQCEIMRALGLSKNTVQGVLHEKTWRYIKI